MPISEARVIVQCTLDGKEIAEFPSAKIAARQFGGRSSYVAAIGACANINSAFRTFRGYKWKYKD